MFQSLLVVGLLISGSTAAGQDAGVTAPPAKPVKEKKVCRLEDGETTSRMRRRVCRTVKEWDATNEQADVSAQRPGMRSR